MYNENYEELERLLLHTAVRWLSKGNCLSRFFELFDTVTEFLDTSDPVLSENLKQRKLELAYLTDIFEKINVSIRLQGNKAKGIIPSLIAKFDIHKLNIGRKELIPTLKKCSVHLQTEFLDLKNDCEAKTIFKQSAYELGES